MDYKTLTELSLGILDPGINANAPQLFEQRTSGVDFSQVKTIYYNNSGKSSTRSLESAKCIIDNLEKRFGKSIRLLGMPEIGEVFFDVSGLISQEEFNQHGMALIRTALYRASISGGVAEPMVQIAERIKIIHKIIEERSKKNESVLFVTHDFFMRFIEVYITREQRLDNVTVEDIEHTSLNSYFCGFRTDSALRILDRWGIKDSN
ncbi:MAG TPA: hypothetical protein DEO26_01505 [Candidatus Veblenbacteria bacterium]|nr:hypothetical protein [Candidatus Veblenbacteria bacterium]HCM45458.1 hypothetical protein [Candidatus Veblenbacteria bacterium]